MMWCRGSLTGKKGPREGRTAQSGGLGDDSTISDSAASLVQRGTENGQENDRCNKTLESEEVLDLGDVSPVHEPPGDAGRGCD